MLLDAGGPVPRAKAILASVRRRERAALSPGAAASDSKARRLYLNIAILLAVLIGVNIVVAWILQFYFNESIMTMASYVAPDGSAMPPGVALPPALGVHYFGDFEQYVGFALTTQSPYAHGVGQMTAAYGPIAILFAKLLHMIFGWPGAAFAFLLGCTIAAFVALAWILGRGREALLVALLMVVSAPVIFALDRGNFQILVTVLCAFFCVGVITDRLWLTTLPLAAVIAIKAYTAVFVFVLVKQRRWKALAITIGTTACLYAAGFLLVRGTFFSNIAGFVKANLYFGGSGHNLIAATSGIAGLIYKYLVLFMGYFPTQTFHANLSGWWVQAPGIVVLVICAAILVIAKGAPELELIAVFAATQLAPVGSFPYLQLALVVELALVLRALRTASYCAPRRAQQDEEGPAAYIGPTVANRRLLAIVAFVLAVGIAPWVFRFTTLGPISTSAGIVNNTLAAWTIGGPTANLLAVLIVGVVAIRTRIAPRQDAEARERINEISAMLADA